MEFFSIADCMPSVRISTIQMFYIYEHSLAYSTDQFISNSIDHTKPHLFEKLHRIFTLLKGKSTKKRICFIYFQNYNEFNTLRLLFHLMCVKYES